MKIINLPTFAEYASSKGGCGVRFTNNFKGGGGKYRQNLEALYFSHCELLDNMAKGYLLNCNYFDIDLATDEITQDASRQMRQLKRTKMKNW